MGIREEISEQYDGILFADGLDRACIGVARRYTGDVACYDVDMCIEVFMEDGMTYEDAREYFEYNVIGAFMGEFTPVFVERFGNGYLNLLGDKENAEDN
ncbi:hypothetical protein DRO61_10315 [Candidatus Bathyarchaeota archaeon]|nr:MAG: hypothetical protein DRO61_10315 [Candidatus Bathyarchaeota archaeon]